MDEKKHFFEMSERIEYSLSVSQTTCIKGIFVVLIFLSHICQYIDTKSLPFFRLYLLLGSCLGQLIVAPFLFYSGYGVMEQIKDKDESYVEQMPKKRIFKTWLHFALAVTIYLVIALYLQSGYSLKTIFFSYIGWESLGNSNWYIFAILIMYTCIYVSFKIFKDNRATWACLILSLIYIAIMYWVKERWWYDTILCFSVGGACFILHYYYQKNS